MPGGGAVGGDGLGRGWWCTCEGHALLQELVACLEGLLVPVGRDGGLEGRAMAVTLLVRRGGLPCHALAVCVAHLRGVLLGLASSGRRRGRLRARTRASSCACLWDVSVSSGC